jgi:predicted DNA-binding antitoxin AbrB/MazE fold protein
MKHFLVEMGKHQTTTKISLKKGRQTDIKTTINSGKYNNIKKILKTKRHFLKS